MTVSTSDEIPFLIIGILLLLIFLIGILLEILCAILFIFHTIQKTKYFLTGFFCILTFGYAFDVIALTVQILATWYKSSIFDLILWFAELLLGPWNTLTAFNRFTAICFWKSHDKIWSRRNVIVAIFFMFLYPLLFVGYLFAKNSYCVIHNIEPTCFEIVVEGIWMTTISNGCHVAVAAALGLITAYACQCKIVIVTPETKKFQQFLLAQSAISVALFGIYWFQFLTQNRIDHFFLEHVIRLFTGQYYIFFRISSTILLLFLSNTVRQHFIDFYLCKCCCGGKKFTVKRGLSIAYSNHFSHDNIMQRDLKNAKKRDKDFIPKMAPAQKLSTIFASPRPQTFSVPYNYVLYMLENPACPKLLKKFYKTCKFFFAKNPIIVTVDFHCRDVGFCYWPRDEKGLKVYAKFWPCWYFAVRHKFDFNKIYRFSPINLRIRECTLTMEEFDLIIAENKVEEFYLDEATIENGTVDLILKKLPKAFSFAYDDKLEAYPLESLEKLNMIERTVKFKFFGFRIWQLAADCSSLPVAEFLEKNAEKNCDFNFEFLPVATNSIPQFAEGFQKWKNGEIYKVEVGILYMKVDFK